MLSREAQAYLSAGTSKTNAEPWARLNATPPHLGVSGDGLGGDGVRNSFTLGHLGYPYVLILFKEGMWKAKQTSFWVFDVFGKLSSWRGEVSRTG